MLVIDLKRLCSRLLFVGELAIFGWVYLFGLHGFSYLHHLKADCQAIEQQIACTSQEVNQLKETVIAWNVHPYFHEKIAREQLQMARKDERVYYLT